MCLRRFAIVALLIVAPSLAAQTSLLQNGSFDGSTTGWQVVNDQDQSSGYSPIDATGRPNSGSAIQTFLRPTVSGRSLASVYQFFDVVPGGSYRFGGKIRTRVTPTTNFSPPKLAILWFDANDRELAVSTRVFANGSLTPEIWASADGTALAPPEASRAVVALFIPSEQNFSALFDDIYVVGPPGSCARIARDLSISFRGRTSGCAPRATGCIAGETIDFTAVAPEYQFASCDRFTWNFGDGGSSTSQTPSRAFTGAGPFTVTLVIQNVSGSAQASTTLDFSPSVAITTLPQAIVQTGAGGGTASYTIRNIGGSPTQIAMGQSGSFFTQSPSSMTLQPGESRTITITGAALAAGRYEGTSTPSGPGVPPNSSVPIRLLSASPPSGPVLAAPVEKRIDVQTSPTASTVGGTASFENRSSNTANGIVVSDVPWLIPQSEPVSIPPGGTGSVSFTINRSLRTDGGTLGAAVGNLMLTYLNGPAPAKAGEISLDPNANPGTASASVAVVHTVTPGSSPGAIPPLAAGEVAMFIPGVAHAPGSVGLFISDLTLTNLLKSGALSNFRMYFRPAASGASAASPAFSLTANQPLRFGDIARTVFGNSTSVGTVHLRGQDVGSVSASASVFNSSNPAGTYGTAIPAFRSDRSAGAGERIFLTGLKSDATNHTNVYLQETSGAAASVTTNFFNAVGVSVGTRSDSLEAFGMLQIGNVAPIGAVSATVIPAAGSPGRVISYATPVDRASGDTWAVLDWSRHYGYSPAEPVLIPVVAAVRGANNTYFRTDASLMNAGTASGSGTLRFYSRAGQIVDRQVTLGPGQSIVYNDILTGLFAVTGDDVGYVVFTPSASSFSLTSRTYTTVAGQNATFGSGTPTLTMGTGTRLGQSIRFGGIDDASVETIVSARPGTFRTNVGMVETSGQAVTVRATLRFSSGGQRTATQAIASTEIALAPRQFLQINGISGAIIGANRATLGDLSNMQLDLEVISGTGSIVAYASSVDNGTGDSLLRVE